MKHLGDITKISGYKIPPVDIITGGSPCQDLSVAGNRAGLSGERSGLFMEQIRIIKEMRENEKRSGRANEFIRPRYMVWENVPGAFSSNKGEDFRAVLEETAKVADSNAIIPRLETKNGRQKWSKSGCILGDGWSIAWRLHDAQFWGVPQRRKRIALVADFGGDTAPKILFEREGVSGDITESGEEGQRTTGNAEGGTGKAISFQERSGKPGGGKGILIQDERIGALSTLNNQSVCCLNDQGGSQMGVTEDVTGTLRAEEHGHQPVVYGISSYDSNAMKSSNPHSGVYEAETARTLDNNGGSPACNQGGMAVVESAGLDSFNQAVSEEVASTIRCAEGGDSAPKVVAFTQNQRNEVRNLGEKAGALAAERGVHQQTYVLERNGSRPSHKGDGYAESETMYTLNSTEHHSVAYRKTSHAKSAEDGQGWAETEVNDTLNAFDSGETRTPTVVLENHPADSRVKISEDGMVQTLSSRMGTGGGNVPMVMEAIGGEVAGTLDASYYKGCGERNGKEREVVATVGALCARGHKGVGSQYVEEGKVVTTGSIVRRLTPLECERLQGFPDGWTDIGDWIDHRGRKRKGSADSPRYKALGNSIALPFWQWLAERMVKWLPDSPTMGSLFDGIGGFPLVYSRVGCEPIWASEIEDFPIAVTKKRFPDVERRKNDEID